MNLTNQFDDFQRCMHAVERMLGQPARPIDFHWTLESVLRKRMRVIRRMPLWGDHPVLRLEQARRGIELRCGLEEFELVTDREPIRLVRVVPPDIVSGYEIYETWAVAVADFRRLYRFVRRLDRSSSRASSPIMAAIDRELLWKNTIGFLGRGQELLGRFNVPRRRGVLLLGSPGNGKTMACRWLSYECKRRGFDWRTVTMARYEAAQRDGEVSELFDLSRPGIVLFDDFDRALWKRSEDGADTNLTTFLTELDGVTPTEGVIFVFTSNAKLEQVDRAFRRPGRIDLILEFRLPDAVMRRQLVMERWEAELRDHIRIDEVVRMTDGFSFAEIEELRKLCVIHYLDTETWDWQAAWNHFRGSHPRLDDSRRLGFQPAAVANAASTTTVAQFGPDHS
jgi:hypothetical protein